MHSNSPATDDGSTCAELFVDAKTIVVDVYGMKTDNHFVKNLEDNIRKLEAMENIISDST